MNTAQMIKVMQAYEAGRTIVSDRGLEYRKRANEFFDWDWRRESYEIKPETLEEAANSHVDNLNVSKEGITTFNALMAITAFKAGAKWQEERGND